MKHLKLFESLNTSDDPVKFLWDFFIDIKDDGLEVDIKSGPFIEFHGLSQINYGKKIILVTIEDPNEVYGFVYVSLEHKKPISDILKRLKSIGIESTCNYSFYNRLLTITFKKNQFN